MNKLVYWKPADKEFPRLYPERYSCYSFYPNAIGKVEIGLIKHSFAFIWFFACLLIETLISLIVFVLYSILYIFLMCGIPIVALFSWDGRVSKNCKLFVGKMIDYYEDVTIFWFSSSVFPEKMNRYAKGYKLVNLTPEIDLKMRRTKNF
jgi:hypothetical protein